jgi:hypothetical protein
MRKGLKWFALAMAVAIAAGGASAQTSAQNWPAKSIRVIVPYPPGGLSDVFARLVGDELARLLGQSVVIDNRPGGNTTCLTISTRTSPRWCGSARASASWWSTTRCRQKRSPS